MKICIKCGVRFEGGGWGCPECNEEPETRDGYLAFAPELSQASEGFEPHYFERLYKLEAKNFWFNSRNRLLVWAVKRYFSGAKNFLEIGCGTGFVLSAFEKACPEMELCGSEIYSAGLSFAGKRVARARLFQMDARVLPFEEEFDLIGAFDVLEHIADDEAVLGQMYRAARPGGGIILTVPQHPSLWSSVDEHARHVRRYTSAELKAKVADAGFRVERATSFVSLLLPLFAASRLRARKVNADFDAEAELRIGPMMNGIFEKVLDIERLIIRAGVSLPAGSSLLLIARKV